MSKPLPERVATLEARMDSIETHILGELKERKENQQLMAKDILELKKIIWKGLGFLTASQLALSIFLKWVFSK